MIQVLLRAGVVMSKEFSSQRRFGTTRATGWRLSVGQIIVKNGTARLDGTLAGTTLPYWWECKIWCIGVLVKWAS